MLIKYGLLSIANIRCIILYIVLLYPILTTSTAYAEHVKDYNIKISSDNIINIETTAQKDSIKRYKFKGSIIDQIRKPISGASVSIIGTSNEFYTKSDGNLILT